MVCLTEDQIERRVEKMTDHLDACLMSGSMSQRDYDKNMRELNLWSEAQYFANQRARPS